VLPPYFHVSVLTLIDRSLSRARTSRERTRKEGHRVSTGGQECGVGGADEITSQKITELEAAYAYLRREKGNVTVGCQRLSEKHKVITEKAEQ
jgi:hypothetical protein